MTQSTYRRFYKLILVACLVAGLVGAAWQPVQAQSNVIGWTDPVNLSKSGQTVFSLLTADSSGVMHAFWVDSLTGVLYSHSGADGWSEPQEVVFPLTMEELLATDQPVLLMPRLVSGPKNWVYFFWQNSGGLRYSIANTANERTLANWSNGGLVARSSASYDVVVDADGIIHIAFVQPSDTERSKAGVYYIRSIDSGANWSPPVLLYPSSYYRNLITETGTQLVDNSVDLSVTTIAGEKVLFAAFDNQPRKSTFVVRSLDGGVTWTDAVEVDGPVPGSALSAPGQIHVSARGKNALLAWQVRQSDTVCFTYYRSSDDGGATWTENQRIYTPYSGCADTFDFLSGYDANSLLITTANNLSYLNAWDGKTWTEFQLQSPLSSFIDPETQDNIAFTPQDWTLVGTDRLAVIGIDRGTGGDTWITTRSLADAASWFAGQPGWKVTADIETLGGTISDLQVIGDSTETLHAFWVQKEIVDDTGIVLVPVEPSRVVYYSSLKNDRWTDPVQILRAPRYNEATAMSSLADDVTGLVVAAGPDDRLWAVWKNSVGGEVYFSWARASAASSVSEWSDPALIATIPITATDLAIAVDRGGWMSIAYTVAVNEGRGVYLVQSRDQGVTWTGAVTVFDAQAQNWERVGRPSLAAAADGSLWLLFSHQPVGANDLASGVYAVHSPDRGLSWSAPETVSSEHVLWNQMLAQSDQILHRLWMEKKGNDEALLFHQASSDGGKTWGRVSRISDAAGSPGPAAATVDRAGQVHLAQVLEDGEGRLLLRYWLWNGSSWNEQDDFDLGSGRLEENMNAVALGISPQGQLGGVASRALIGQDAYKPDTLLVGLVRPVTLPRVVETTLPPLPTVTSEPQVQASQTPAATPTIDTASLNLGSPSTGGGTLGGLMVAFVAALLVIGAGVGFALVRARRRKGD